MWSDCPHITTTVTITKIYGQISKQDSKVKSLSFMPTDVVKVCLHTNLFSI